MIVKCPNCHILILIEEINCNIFRCGIYKCNLQPIPPHSSKEIIECLLKNDLIYGCGSPFTIKNNNAIICAYI